MSTIYTFHRELASLASPASGDRIPVGDMSTGTTAGAHPTHKDMTLSIMAAAARGTGTTDLIGFYGATPIDQGTMTATCLTALTTNPTLSASNTGAGVFGFSSSTDATNYVTRIQQMQADLDTLIDRIESTGLLAVTGN